MSITSHAQTISYIKRTAIARIKRAVAPYLHDSGFVDESRPNGRLRLVVLKRLRKIRRPVSLAMDEGFFGFTEYGLITDGYAGALETIGYEQISVEDIIKLDQIVGSLKPEQFKTQNSHRD